MRQTLPFELKEKTKTSLLCKSYQTELTKAIESILRENESYEANIIKDFYNPSKCRADLLPYLANYLGVLFWSDEFSEEQKRKLCQDALAINRKKGTLKALKDVLQNLNLSVAIKEWWQDKENMQKGTAELTFYEQNVNYSQEQYEDIVRLVTQVKRFSLHLIFKSNTAKKGSFYTGAILHNIQRVYIK